MQTESALLSILPTRRHTNTNSTNSLILFPFLAHQDEVPLVQNVFICTMWILAVPRSCLFADRTNPSLSTSSQRASAPAVEVLVSSSEAAQFMNVFHVLQTPELDADVV